MKIVGLDQSLRNSGAAVLDGPRFVLAVAFHQKGGGQAKAFGDFRSWWIDFLETHNPDIVALEEPMRSDVSVVKKKVVPSQFWGQSIQKTKVNISNFDTLLALYGIRAHAIEICESMGIEFVEVNVRTWRSVIYAGEPAMKGVGSDQWKKKAFERCKHLKWNVASHDAAEAALIAEYLRISMTPEGRQRSPDLFGSAA